MIKVATRVILELLRVFVLFVWSILGAIFWIPFLARMTALFTVMVLLSVSRGGSISNAEKGLDSAVRFYVNGFKKINEGINNIVRGKAGENRHQELEKGSIQSLVFQLAYTMVFWTSTVLLIGFLVLPGEPEASNGVHQSPAVEENESGKVLEEVEGVKNEPNKTN